MDFEKLFAEVGFTHEYREKMEHFYSPYFETFEEMNHFFVRVFKCDNLNFIPRKMINQIQRLTTLANNIEKICQNRDSLRMLFLKICLESLASLSGMGKRDFFEKFPQMMTDVGKKYILDNFKILYLQDLETGAQEEYVLTINDFFGIIKAVRDMVVHDGNYWEVQFFAHYEDDYEWLTSFESTDKVLVEYKYENKLHHNICYCFETTLLYDKFVNYFVETCIFFVEDYICK